MYMHMAGPGPRGRRVVSEALRDFKDTVSCSTYYYYYYYC